MTREMLSRPRAGAAWLFVAVGVATIAAFVPIGCSSGDDGTTPTPEDSGTVDSGSADTQLDTTMGETQGETGGDATGDTSTTLSARAQAGIAASPFMVDLTGKTADQQEMLGIGSYFVNVVGACNDCHQQTVASGPPKYLGGGTSFALDAAGDKVYARNLTTDATTGMKLTQDQFIAALRTGADHTNMGQALIVMPWPSFRWLSTRDLTAIYAYLKVVPPVSNAVPADVKGPYAAAMPVPFPTSYGDGDVSRPLPAEMSSDTMFADRGLAISPLADPPSLASLSATDKGLYGRGSYLVNSVGDCNGCHTNPERDLTPGPNFLKITTAAFLTGGRVFPVPPPVAVMSKYTRTMSQNLLGSAHGFPWSDATKFKNALTNGDDPDGTRKLGFPMPWNHYKGLVAEDVTAIYTYLSKQAPITGTNDKATQDPAIYCTADTDCGTGQTCNTATKECIGKACSKDSDCGACQTCTSSKCAAPAATSSCLTSGI